jgi:hypothetical protein
MVNGCSRLIALGMWREPHIPAWRCDQWPRWLLEGRRHPAGDHRVHHNQSNVSNAETLGVF